MAVRDAPAQPARVVRPPGQVRLEGAQHEQRVLERPAGDAAEPPGRRAGPRSASAAAASARCRGLGHGDDARRPGAARGPRASRRSAGGRDGQHQGVGPGRRADDRRCQLRDRVQARRAEAQRASPRPRSGSSPCPAARRAVDAPGHRRQETPGSARAPASRSSAAGLRSRSAEPAWRRSTGCHAHRAMHPAQRAHGRVQPAGQHARRVQQLPAHPLGLERRSSRSSNSSRRPAVGERRDVRARGTPSRASSIQASTAIAALAARPPIGDAPDVIQAAGHLGHVPRSRQRPARAPPASMEMSSSRSITARPAGELSTWPTCRSPWIR